MKLLWVVNTIFPDAAHHIGITPVVYGGWMYGLAADLAKKKDIYFAVVTSYTGKALQSFTIKDICYYLIPKQDIYFATCWQKIISEVQPDIVHIHGTEFGYGMILMQTYPNLQYLASMQGLVSVCHRYFMAGLTVWDVLKNITLRDVLRCDTLFHRQNFYQRGIIEKEYIRCATAVIGRTAWDYAHAKAIRPDVIYHHCNESLRNEFYTGEKWSLDQCHQHSIFLSQAGYPVKGLHIVLKAAALLKNDYPDLIIYVAGHNIVNLTTLKDKFKRNGYSSYLLNLIKKLKMEKHVCFLGPLQAAEMKAAYLRAHIFICPSSIENSPNSLGEAQITGTPCIASYVGGIPDMLTHEYDGLLYRFEEIEMLAECIRKIFTNTEFTKYFSCNAIKTAEKRHDRKVNLQKMIKIYNNK